MLTDFQKEIVELRGYEEWWEEAGFRFEVGFDGLPTFIRCRYVVTCEKCKATGIRFLAIHGILVAKGYLEEAKRLLNGQECLCKTEGTT